MSEIVKKRVKENVGKVVTFWTKNNFKYTGKLIGFDDDFIEIFDFVKKGYKILRYSEIKEVDAK